MKTAKLSGKSLIQKNKSPEEVSEEWDAGMRLRSGNIFREERE